MSPATVIGLGALNVDQIYRVERILEDGEAVVREAILSPGGSAANTIYGLARLGVSTGFIGVIGDDSEGRLVRAELQSAGVDIAHVKVKPGTRTGAVLCLTDSLGHRALYVWPGANSRLTAADIDLDYVNRASILHLSSFADEAQLGVTESLIKGLSPSVKISFAPGALYTSKGLERLKPILSRTHVLFLNQGELRALTGEDVIASAGTCLKAGCQIVAVTLGKGDMLTVDRKKATASAYIRTARAAYAIPAAWDAEDAVDTTGAGDAFAAGFLFGLLKGKTIEECGRLGNTVARFSITKMGAREGLPTLSQLAERYQELYHHSL
ncbi:MAG: carbohydrate kinase family protein [Chloroflexi bacterium]|nr:carbohydrate kinase family protein [Chloroflexota bacterium]